MSDDIKTLEIDDSPVDEVLVEIPLEKKHSNVDWNKFQKPKPIQEGELINCLRNEVIVVKHINKKYLLTDNPKHSYFGGMAEKAVKKYTVPLAGKDTLANPLTKDEQRYLEDIMQFVPGTLSIYAKSEDNFWINFWVELGKDDNYLNLSDPMDYIKYKVLLCNTDFISPDLESLNSQARVTYEFVMVSQTEQRNNSKSAMTKTTSAYRWFGQIEKDKEKLMYVIAIMSGKPIDEDSDIEFLAAKAHEELQRDPGLFSTILEDKLFDTKLLIQRAVKNKLITKSGNFYYVTDGRVPMTENSIDPTLQIAAGYLANPKRQNLKLSLEAKLK